MDDGIPPGGVPPGGIPPDGSPLGGTPPDGRAHDGVPGGGNDGDGHRDGSRSGQRGDGGSGTEGDTAVAAPLDGVLVADFSRVLAGPYATMVLADLGATVVKVERRGTGDDTRSWGPPWTANDSAYYECLNRGKRGIALDLEDPADRDYARELARRADVLVENFRHGSLARHGLDHETTRAANPGLVYTSISGFGSAAGAELPGYDFVAQAVGGLMSITGHEGGEPTKVGVAVVDVLTGKDAVAGILAALRERDRTGYGQHVEVNLLSSLLGGLANQIGGQLATGTSPRPMGNQHPSVAPYETLCCADGLLAVAVGNDAQFARFAGVLGLDGMAADERFATNAARVRNRSAMVERLEGELARLPASDWQRRLQDAGVACGPVHDVGQAVGYAESLGLRPVMDLGNGHIPQVRNPIGFSTSALADPSPPPRLGEHDDEVRAWLADPSTVRLGHAAEPREPATSQDYGYQQKEAS